MYSVIIVVLAVAAAIVGSYAERKNAKEIMVTFFFLLTMAVVGMSQGSEPTPKSKLMHTIWNGDAYELDATPTISNPDVKQAQLYYHKETFESVLMVRTKQGKLSIYKLTANDHKNLLADDRVLATLNPVK